MTKPVEIDKDNELKLIRERVVAFCNENGYALSLQADKIFGDIVRMKELTGDFYCPCQKQQLPRTVCVCQAVRNGLVDVTGECFCHLIVSTNK